MDKFNNVVSRHEQQLASAAAAESDQRRIEQDEENAAWFAFQECLVRLVRPIFERETKTIWKAGFAAEVRHLRQVYKIELLFSPRKGDRNISDANACAFLIEREPGRPGVRWSHTILHTANEQQYAIEHSRTMPLKYLTETWLEHQLGEFYTRAFAALIKR